MKPAPSLTASKGSGCCVQGSFFSLFRQAYLRRVPGIRSDPLQPGDTFRLGVLQISPTPHSGVMPSGPEPFGKYGLGRPIRGDQLPRLLPGLLDELFSDPAGRIQMAFADRSPVADGLGTEAPADRLLHLASQPEHPVHIIPVFDAHFVDHHQEILQRDEAHITGS